jgi:hypothetical protein
LTLETLDLEIRSFWIQQASAENLDEKLVKILINNIYSPAIMWAASFGVKKIRLQSAGRGSCSSRANRHEAPHTGFLQSIIRYVSLPSLHSRERNFFKASVFTLVLHPLAKLITVVFP